MKKFTTFTTNHNISSNYSNICINVTALLPYLKEANDTHKNRNYIQFSFCDICIVMTVPNIQIPVISHLFALNQHQR
jgi:hypothetical protein